MHAKSPITEPLADIGPLGLIAGGGELPFMIARQAIASGRDVCVIGIANMVTPALIQEFSGHEVKIGQVGKLLDILHEAGCQDLVMAGLVRRPNFNELVVDGLGASLLPRIALAAVRGDAALLKTLTDFVQEQGLRVRSVQEIAPTLKIGQGPLEEGLEPQKQHWPDIKKAAEIVATLGPLDIGQAVIVCTGLVLCVEGQEGTKKMLERCADLSEEIRGTAEARRGVLLKAPKSIQDLRTDMPVIGVKTVQDAADAGLAGIALEAGGALVLDMEGVAQRARETGLFIYGYGPDEV